MEYKSGPLYRLGGVGIFKYRKKYWFILTRSHLLYYASPEKLTNPIETIALTDIKNITLLQKEQDSLHSTYGFVLEYSATKLVLQSDPLSNLADWVIKIDGLIHPNFSTFLDVAERKQLLKILFKNNIKGGIIKYGGDEECWNYSNLGSLYLEESGPDEKIDYHWDGEWLRSSAHSQTLGCGRFNGVFLAWYNKDPKQQPSAIPDTKYFWDEKEREYISDRKEFTFKWTRHFLASKYGSGEWIVEGHVPQPVVMLLQIIKYKRISLSSPDTPTPFTSLSTSTNSSTPLTSPVKDSQQQQQQQQQQKDQEQLQQQQHTQKQLESMMANPDGSVKASTMKIAPYSKGNAVLNVSHVLFSAYQEPQEEEQTNIKLNFSTSSSVSDEALTSSINQMISSLDSSNNHHHHQNNNGSESADQINNSNITNNIDNNEASNNLTSSTTTTNSSSLTEQENSILVSSIDSTPQSTSTLQLLNDTIHESKKLQTRLSMQSIPSPSMFRNSDSSTSTRQLHRRHSSISSNHSIQSNQSSNNLIKHFEIPQSPITTTTIQEEPTSTLLNQSNETNSVYEQQQTTTLSMKPLPDLSTSPPNSSGEEPIMLKDSYSSECSIPMSPPSPPFPSTPLGSVIGPSSHEILEMESRRKPLAKSSSSDRVTTIINQITSSKQVRQSFCLACNLPIQGHMTVAMGNHFHQECFKCSKCCKELGTKTFYRQIIDNLSNSSSTISPSLQALNTKFNNISPPISHHHPHQNLNNNKSTTKYLCESCFDSICPVCPTCNTNVMYRCVNALGKKWHPDHFCCIECQIPLNGSIFYERNGEPYCSKDYNRLFLVEPNNSNNNNNTSNNNLKSSFLMTPSSNHQVIEIK
eukprot:gene9278-11373_t